MLPTLMEDDFIITGSGNNDLNAAACCLVEGWDVINFNNISYTAQKLYKNDEEAGKRKVDPIANINPLTTSSRVDLIYLDVWEREVNHYDDKDLINPEIGVPTCVRREREWAVRVVEDISGKLLGQISAEDIKKDEAKKIIKNIRKEGHRYLPLAVMNKTKYDNHVNVDMYDLRTTGIRLESFVNEIKEARGSKGSLNDRLIKIMEPDGSLKAVVGDGEIKKWISENKVKFDGNNGHDHSGGDNGKPVLAGAVADGVIENRHVTSTGEKISEEKVQFLDSGDNAHDHSGTNNKGKKIDFSKINGLYSTVNNSNLKILTQGSSSDASSLHCHKKTMIYSVPFPLTNAEPLDANFTHNIIGMQFAGGLNDRTHKALGHLNLPQKCKIIKAYAWISGMKSGDKISVIIYKRSENSLTGTGSSESQINFTKNKKNTENMSLVIYPMSYSYYLWFSIYNNSNGVIYLHQLSFEYEIE